MKTTIKGFVCSVLCVTAATGAFAQTAEQRRKIVSSYDLGKLKEMQTRAYDKYFKNKTEALRLAAINNWPVTLTAKDGSYQELMYVSEDGRPIYFGTHNQGAANTAKVNRINSGGTAGLNLNGQNMIVGLWDGGPVRTTHVALVGRVTYMDGEVFSSSTESTEHATHVSGTMIGSGAGAANAKGLAYQASIWGNTFANDEAEVLGEISQGLLVSNHSYGIVISNVTQGFHGAYSSEAQEWDDILYNAPYYQAVISAGNDRGSAQDTQGGMDLLLGNKNAKNAVIVAAVYNVPNYVGPESVNMSTFSSWGPTDDYRIKPDISMKGVSVYSLSSASDTAFQTLQGTSMAAPGVSACLLLMQQYYNEKFGSFMKAATLRALMINSAEEAGDYDGPDYKFGWGLINAERGAQIITGRNSTSLIEELSLAQGQVYTKTVTADPTKPLKVTVVWNDPAGALSTGTNSTTPVLVNDLDVRVTKGAETYYPWGLNPFFLQGGAVQDDNVVDNVESIDVPGPTSGVYTIKVTHKGTLVNGPQNFSLVVNGVSIPLAVADNKFDNLQVYPNPVTDKLNVQLNASDAEALTLSLFDLQGRQISQAQYQDNLAQFNQSVDMSQLASGVYFLKINQGSKSFTQKVIKK